MAYVIYHTAEYRLWKGASRAAKVYATTPAAKAQLTKLTKGENPTLKAGEWDVASYEAFAKMEPSTTVESLTSGKTVEIRASARGNPALDPSMEGYWSM